MGVERSTRARAILRPLSSLQANPPKAREKEMRRRYKFYILPAVADICHRYSHHGAAVCVCVYSAAIRFSSISNGELG